MAAKVLLYTNDCLLAETRRWLLEQAGFEVTLAAGMLEAFRALTTRQVDLFILCHSLSYHDCESAVAFSHQVRPKMRNLLLKSPFSHRQQRKNDVVYSAPLNPKALVQMVRSLTETQQDTALRFSAEPGRFPSIARLEGDDAA